LLLADTVCRIAEANCAFVAGIIADNAGAKVGRYTGAVSLIAGLGNWIARRCARLTTIYRIASLYAVAEHAVVANQRITILTDTSLTGFVTVADSVICARSTVRYRLRLADTVCRIADIFHAYVAGGFADNAGAELGRYTGVGSLIAGLGCRVTRLCARLTTIYRIAGLQTVTEHAVVANQRLASLTGTSHTGFVTVADIAV
jgi:hypothetical protein